MKILFINKNLPLCNVYSLVHTSSDKGAWPMALCETRLNSSRGFEDANNRAFEVMVGYIKRDTSIRMEVVFLAATKKMVDETI